MRVHQSICYVASTDWQPCLKDALGGRSDVQNSKILGKGTKPTAAAKYSVSEEMRFWMKNVGKRANLSGDTLMGTAFLSASSRGPKKVTNISTIFTQIIPSCCDISLVNPG